MRVAGRPRRTLDQYVPHIDNSRLELQRDPAERARCARVVGVAGCLFLLVFGLVLLHVKNQHYGYELSQLRSESAALRLSNQELRLEKARLTDPQRIARLAEQDLGLEQSQPQQWVHWNAPARIPADSDVVARSTFVPAAHSQRSLREP